VRLAVERNPDLQATRTRRGVAGAALLQSGILPNPSVSGAILPLIAGAGFAPAWSAALSYDVKGLITYHSRRRSAHDMVGQAAADVLWQEWLVAGQARQLTVNLLAARRQLVVANEAWALLSARDAVMRQALAKQDATLVLAAPVAAAALAAQTSRNAIAQRELLLRHQLNALLGLHADAMLTLAPDAVLPPFDGAAIRAGLASLPDRRPDLLALRLGYAAQEESVRQAILTQFPDLVLGGSSSSDSSKVVNVGPSASFGLPIFDRNQGTIAAARATRAQLQAEYSARLATTTGEVEAGLTEMEQLARQLAAVRTALPAARLAAERAQVARTQSAIEENSYVDLVATYFTRELDVMMLEAALADRQVALQTLIGAGLPAVETLPAMEAVR
jgi:outer membrane protein TolC